MDVRDGVADQFSGRGERADVWRAFDLFLDTDRYLNLGYSAWYQPHALPSSQRRLATVIGRRLAADVADPDGTRLLDVGCGRGGPAVHLARRSGFRVLGVDLVTNNVASAVENARRANADTAFVVGDATALPVATASQGAAMAVDALVYLPDREAALAEVARTLEPGGPLVMSDLVRAGDLAVPDHETVDAFAAAWDMAPPATRADYERWVGAADLRLVAVEDITPHSVGQFRRWTRPFLGLVDGPAGSLVEEAVARSGLDPDALIEGIRRTHHALPHIRHVLVRARSPG